MTWLWAILVTVLIIFWICAVLIAWQDNKRQEKWRKEMKDYLKEMGKDE